MRNPTSRPLFELVSRIRTSGRITSYPQTIQRKNSVDLLGLPPTGRPVTMTGQEIFRVRDGQLVEVWHLEDIGALMRGLDLEPPRMMLLFSALLPIFTSSLRALE